MVPAPGADSVGNGDLGSDREDSDLLTDAYAERSPHSRIPSAGRLAVLARSLPVAMARARRTALATLAALVVIVGTVASIGVAAVPPASAANWAPVGNSDFPDPSILQWGGGYYAFATQNFAVPSQTINIQAATSLDGINWTGWNGPAVLPQVGSWAKPGDTWAPSVVRDNADNDFVMYYTATEIQSGDQCIGVATSSSPTGPYADSQSQPMVCQNGTGYPDPTVDSGGQDLGGSIDPDVFTDSSTGDSYLIWKSDGNHLNPPINTTLWSVRLGPGFLPTGNAQPTALMSDDQAWQSGIVEGPDMVETSTTTGGNSPTDDILVHPLLLGQRRRGVHLCHRVGQLRRPLGAVYR